MHHGPRTSGLVILAICSCAIAASCHTQTTAPGHATVPAEPAARMLRANIFTPGEQDNAAVAIHPDSGAVVVWDSRRQQGGTYGVYARRLDPFGRALSDEVQVNAFTRGMQLGPDVGIAPDGRTWIAWTSVGQDGDAGGVVLRAFDPSLAPLTGEIGVNTTREGDQHSPSLAIDDAGRILVLWSHEARGRPARIAGRIFDGDARPVTGEFWVQDDDGIRHTMPSGAAVPQGAPGPAGFLVAWASADADGEPLGVFARRLDGTGSPLAPAFRLNFADGRDHVEPAIGIGTDGTVLGAWLVAHESGYGALMRRFDALGNPLCDPAPVEAEENALLSGLAIAALPPGTGGGWAVAYNRRGDAAADPAGHDRIVACLIDRDGTRRAAPIVAAGDVRGQQRLRAARATRRLAARADGVLVLAWGGDSGLGDRHAANLSLIGPATMLAFWPEAPIPRGEGPEPAAILASGPGPDDLPPVWDPNWRPEPPLGGIAGNGPDFGFEAIQGTGWTPPDPEMAAGFDHLVGIVNGQIAVFDKTGKKLSAQPIEGPGGFWGQFGPGTFIFDPEAHWDPHHDRFWVMACERTGGKSFFNYAVSKGPDPASGWNKYRVDVTALIGSGDIDSPQLAVDDQALYLSSDHFSPDRYFVYILPKAPLLAGMSAPAGTWLTITGSHSYGFPVTHDAGAPAQYMIQSTEQGTNTVVIFHALRDVLTAPTRVTFSLPVPAYHYPVSATQKGSSVVFTLFEPRFWSCIYRDGSLWAAHHIRLPGGSNTIVRWYEFSMNGWPQSGGSPAVKQWGQVDPGPGLHAYFVSIGVDEHRNAALTFARSGALEFPSMWRAMRRAADPPGTMRQPVLVKASTSPFVVSRWGDYSATQADPAAPCVFWGHHEWTTSTNSWRTWMARYDVYAKADLSKDCALDIDDFVQFQVLFALGDPLADFDGNGVLDIEDFVAFQIAFALGY